MHIYWLFHLMAIFYSRSFDQFTFQVDLKIVNICTRNSSSRGERHFFFKSILFYGQPLGSTWAPRSTSDLSIMQRT